MDFNDLLNNAKEKRTKSRWKVDEILESVPGPTAQAIRDALLDEDNSDAVIVEALKGLGIKVGESSVRRYRNEVLEIK